MSEALAPELLDRVLDRLGVERPRPDRAGLEAVYGRWCERVPFDNLRKRLHLHRGETGALPGDDASDFFEAWLETGAGGTCWAGNNALFTLLATLGFPARRGVGAMLPFEIPNPEPSHGTVVVELDGETLLVDASMLHVAPLPLDPDRETRLDSAGWGVRARLHEGDFHVTWHPGGGDPFDCRLLKLESDADEFRARHERSRTWSPFNQQLSFRRVCGDRVIGIGMGRRFVTEPGGETRVEETDDTERRRFLVEEGGIDERFVGSLPADEPLPEPGR